MAYTVTTAEWQILNFKVILSSFDRFLGKIKVPGVIFASKSTVGQKIVVKVPKWWVLKTPERPGFHLIFLKDFKNLANLL